MKRYLKYILLSLASATLAVSCLEELEPTPSLNGTDQVAVIVPRVKSFTNQYVTKAGYDDNEKAIYTLNVLIFNKEGKLAHAQNVDANTHSFTLNKSMLNSPDNGDLASATVVMLANINLNLLKANGEPVQSSLSSLTLDALANSTYYPEQNIILSSELGTSSFKGFPMIGGVSDVNLEPTSVTAPQDPIVIYLKILFAKIEFEINVEQGSENQGEGMQFTLNSWAVNNVSRATTLAVPTNNGEPVRDFMGNIPDEENVATADEATASSEYTTTAKSGSLPETKTTTLNGTPLKFTFYMAESRYNPGTYTYPINDLHESFKQQFKPEVATTQGGSPAVGMASYVLLNGEYIDYRGTSWNVEYTIYLGKNSYDNFHVDRNSMYKNIISIKGIRDRQNGSYGEGDVWIDHRVDVSYADDSADDCVTITRETLLDAHIEVRPLRVNLAEAGYVAAAVYLPKYPLDAQGSSWGQIEEIEGGMNENWIAIENNNGKYNKGKLHCSNGKRKYFTTSLIEELHLDNNAEENGIATDNNGNKFIPLRDGECAWIYFDENGTTNLRRAQIDVVFYTSTGGTTTETFDIYQSGLKTFGGIQFEAYEEYLHSYDSQDRYGLATSPTDYTQQGLSWGMMTDINGDGVLDGYQLSEKYIVKSLSGGEDFVGERYDYGHKNDFSDYYTKEKIGTQWVDVNTAKNTGVWFTYRAADKASMTVMDMGTRPESAYQYCLSKNKFHEDPNGEDHKMALRWYLPDVYEMQTILQDDSSEDFDSNVYYWSSQPSYNSNSRLGIIEENDEFARAVSSADKQPYDLYRTEQHRIRCAYYAAAPDTSMTNRVPDGLGGIIRIPMKAYERYPDVKGYFYNWLDGLDEKGTDVPQIPDYAFPKGNDAHTFTPLAYNDKIYYIENPLTNWSYSEYNRSDNTLYHYPGLSTKEVVTSGLLNLKYIESTDDKKYQTTYSTITGQKIETLPSNEGLLPLDYLDKTDSLTISFNRGSNTSNTPSYSYRREDTNKTLTYTQYWDPPQYRETSVKATSGSEKTITVTSSVYNDYDILNRKYTYDIGDNYVYENETYKITNRRRTGSWREGYTYYFDLGPTTIDQDCWEYIDGTGGWLAPGPPDSTLTPNPVVDQLELFGGNRFTITAKDGYAIQSIKVNYSGSNSVHRSTLTGGDGGPSDNRFLRLVQTRPTASNVPPQNMSYSGDGDIGWFKWASSGTEDVSSVTLELVTYRANSSFSIGGISLWPASFEYIVPDDETGYKSDFDTSIVIDSFEIRIAEVTD